jgi:hypothetical protein
LFAEFLMPFVTGETTVYVGGAKGIDSLALTWLVANTGVRVVVAAPGEVGGQPEEARIAIAAALEHSPRVEVVELGHPEFPSAAAYHSRNRWMVDRAGPPRSYQERSTLQCCARSTSILLPASIKSAIACVSVFLPSCFSTNCL